MKPVAEYMEVVTIDGAHGTTHYLDSTIADAINEYSDSTEDIYDIEVQSGWFSRLSADGYMDCTEWSGPYENERIAIEEICDLYDVDMNGDELID